MEQGGGCRKALWGEEQDPEAEGMLWMSEGLWNSRVGLDPRARHPRGEAGSGWGRVGSTHSSLCARSLPVLCCRSVTHLPPGTKFVFADKIIQGLIVEGEEKCRLVIP